MRQPLYIQSATAISPQHTFSREDFLNPLVSTTAGKLYALEAPYAQYISPVAIRRMSRILKLTISAAMQCLKDAGITSPDAIIIGTGRGAVTDMEHFVKDMIRLEEGALNPTLFIQSTYNSPNGWIAMQSGCTGYNQTYVHRGCSFELALQDAQMTAAEGGGTLQILAGCYDEMTEEYYIIREKRGYWKQETISSEKLLAHGDTTGTIGGEGSAFFILSNEPGIAQAVISDLSILYGATAAGIRDSVTHMLDAAGINGADISLVLTGLNGDTHQSALYDEAIELFPANTSVAGFKHLCGEYDTATGFGLWLAVYMLQHNKVADEVIIRKGGVQSLKHILFINHYILGTASVMLVSGIR